MAVLNCAANKTDGSIPGRRPGRATYVHCAARKKEVGPTRTQRGRWNVRPGLAPVKAIQEDSGPGVGP